MTAKIDPVVAKSAKQGHTVGILVLVEKEEHPGVAPLALQANLQKVGERTEDVARKARDLLLAPQARHTATEAVGARPLGVVSKARTEPGGVVLENLGAVMAAVTPENLAKLSEVRGVRKVIAMPTFLPLIAPTQYDIAAPAELVDGAVQSLQRAGVPTMWDRGLSGKGVTIGHFDTGINAKHPTFAQLKQEKRLRYAAFGADGARIQRARARDFDIEGIVHHGTHTAGTLVGDVVDGTRVGIAPGAHLVSVQIFPQPAPDRKDQDQVVVNALNWIVGERPRVLNLSFGDSSYNDSYLGVIDELIDQNIVVVAAVGNGGARTSSSPGNYARVIGVGAVNEHNQVCDFSGSASVRRSKRPDLCAPGFKILSAGRGDEFAHLSGTSAAAPHVAAVLALLLQRAPDLSPDNLHKRLIKSAYVPHNWDARRGGAGVLDGAALLSDL